ncbi:MAG: EamA family transporter [Epulopiscium sp.]|nr:EamA family transporter [Candidatus Epulonipiscium sp.]
MKEKSEFKFIISMLIFGSIGLFVKAINMPSSVIVLMRAIIGSLFLILVIITRKQFINRKKILNNLPVLMLSGFVLGAGWVFLFEAYRYTTVSGATLLYYCAPIIVFLLSPILFKESLTWSKIVGIVVAIIGMLIVNGLGIGGSNPYLGLICGVLSALFYATLMILNKFIKNLSGLESTLVQLMIASFVMTVYVLLRHENKWSFNSGMEMFLLITVGILHTGVACYLYFSSIQKLPGQTIAVLSYIDPVSALFFSALFLGERLSLLQILGAFLVLGGTAFSQFYINQGRAQNQQVL